MFDLVMWGERVFHDMFSLGLPLGEKMLRPIVVYIALVVMLRVFGKRELAQLNPFDLIVLLSLSNTVQNALIGDDTTVTGGIIGAFTLLGFNYLVVRFLFRHRRLDQILEGEPTVLVDGGKILPDALAKELMTVHDLQNAAYRQGFEGLSEIEHCVIEPGGTLFLQRKAPSVDEARHKELLAKFDELTKRFEQQVRVGVV